MAKAKYRRGSIEQRIFDSNKAYQETFSWDNAIQIVTCIAPNEWVERLYVKQVIKLTDPGIQDKNILEANNYQDVVKVVNNLSTPVVCIAPYSVGGDYNIYQWRIDKFSKFMFCNVLGYNPNDKVLQEIPPGTIAVGGGTSLLTVPGQTSNHLEFIDMTDRDKHPITNVVQDGTWAKVTSTDGEIIYFAGAGTTWVYLSGISGFQNVLSGWHLVTKVYDWPDFSIGFTHNLGTGAYVPSSTDYLHLFFFSGSSAMVGAKINVIRRNTNCSLEEARFKARLSTQEIWSKERGYGQIDVERASYQSDVNTAALYIPKLIGSCSISSVVSDVFGLYVKHLFNAWTIKSEILPYTTKIVENISGNQTNISTSGGVVAVSRYFEMVEAGKKTRNFQITQSDIMGNSSTSPSIELESDGLLAQLNLRRSEISLNTYKIGIGCGTDFNTKYIECDNIAPPDYYGELYITTTDGKIISIRDNNFPELNDLNEKYFINVRWANHLAEYKADKVPAPIECNVPGDYASINLAIASGKTFINVVSGTHTQQINLPDGVDLNVSAGAEITSSSIYTIRPLGTSRIFGRGTISNTSAADGASTIYSENATLMVECADIYCDSGSICIAKNSEIMIKTYALDSDDDTQEAFALYNNSKIILDAYICNIDNPVVFAEYNSPNSVVMVKNSQINHSGLLCNTETTTLIAIEASILNCTNATDGFTSFIYGNSLLSSNNIKYYYVDGNILKLMDNAGILTTKTYLSEYEAMMAARSIFKANWKKYGTIANSDGRLYYINIELVNTYSVLIDALTVDNLTIDVRTGYGVREHAYLDRLVQGYNFLRDFAGTWLHVGEGYEYATIKAARDAAIAGQAIRVHPGTYTDAILTKDNIVIYYEYGVIHNAGNIALIGNTCFYNNENTYKNFKVLGLGEFVSDNYIWWEFNGGTAGTADFYFEFKEQKADGSRAIFPQFCHTNLFIKGYKHGGKDNLMHTSFIDTDAQVNVDIDIAHIEDVAEIVFQPYKTNNAYFILRNAECEYYMQLYGQQEDGDIGVSNYYFIGLYMHCITLASNDGWGINSGTEGCIDNLSFASCIGIKDGTAAIFAAFGPGGSMSGILEFIGPNYLAKSLAHASWEIPPVITGTIVIDDTLQEIETAIEFDTQKSTLYMINSVWHNDSIFGQYANMVFQGSNVIKNAIFPSDPVNPNYELNEGLSL